jgi:hypothetical protein
VRTLQLSFAAGEQSPEMAMRIDLRQRLAGVRKLRNCISKPQGPAVRRPPLDLVNRVADSAYASRLVPFVYSTDQAIVLEYGHQVIRFHTQGATLLWGTRLEVESVSATSDRITFKQRHGLADDDGLRLLADGGALPLPLDAATQYHAIVVDSHTIQVSAAAGPGAPVDLTDAGSGTIRAFRADSMPDDYVFETPVSSWDQPGSRIVFASPHEFETDDPIKLRDTGAATYPGDPALNPIDVVYAIRVDATSIQLAAEKGGTAIDFSGGAAPSGTFYVDRHYEQGELFYWGGGGFSDPGCYYVTTEHTANPTDPNVSAVYQEPLDGVFEVPAPYEADDVFGVRYAQSNDVLRQTHARHAPRELRRLGATLWDLRAIAFGAEVGPPITGPSIVPNRGSRLIITTETIVGGPNRSLFTFQTRHQLAAGDPIYVADGSTTSLTAGEHYVVEETPNNFDAVLRTVNGAYVNGSATAGAGAQVHYSSLSAENQQTYKITAVAANGVESTPSPPTTVANVLDVSGASNYLSWAGFPVVGALKYRIYREENGLFGRIGETEGTDFTDDGIDADTSLAPPIQDDRLSGTDYPRAVAYHQQRGVFAGTSDLPRQYWLTKSRTESALNFSLPVQDDDRISEGLAAREAATIMHAVPMSELLMLTREGEWLIAPSSGGALTPKTVSNSLLSEIGSGEARPLVVGDVLVFAAARGGHVWSLAYNVQTQKLAPVDLSLRAAHLFDELDIVDSAQSKAPWPVQWWVSTSGKLLGLTHIPDEQVIGWHQHDTEGVFESVCVIPEGQRDSIYAEVRREVDGQVVRTIERMVPQVTHDLEAGSILDGRITHNGIETAGRTLTASDGKVWTKGETLTVTASDHLFRARRSVGDELELRDAAGGRYRLQIVSVTSSTVARCRLVHDLPLELQRTAVADWGYAVRSLSGLDHLEGKTVLVVRDGARDGEHVVSGGTVPLSAPAVVAHAGLRVVSDLEPMPAAMQAEAGGQGRMKSVSRAFVRVDQTAGLRIGPNEDELVPMGELETDELKSGEVRTWLKPDWSPEGTVLIRADGPEPATIVGMTLELQAGD